MAAHGGYREGAGRPLGSANKATIEHKATLSELARSHSEEAVSVLVEIMREGQSDNVRLAAANALLDRGHGKPIKEVVTNIPNIEAPTHIKLIAFEG